MNKNKLLWIVLLLPLSVFAKASERSHFIIALDTGHSPERPGAISARGVGEYNFNKNIAELLHEKLVKAGFTKTLILTARKPEMTLPNRVKLAGAYKADVLLSIHHDSVQPQYLTPWFYNEERHYYSDYFSGHSIFFSGKNPKPEESRTLAMLIGEKIRAAGLTPTLHHAEPIEGENRPLINAELGVYQFDNLIILRRAKMPAVLLECGVIVNRREELQLTDAAYQTKLAESVTRALIEYFEQRDDDAARHSQ